MRYIKPDLNVEEISIDDVILVSVTNEIHDIFNVNEEL